MKRFILIFILVLGLLGCTTPNGVATPTVVNHIPTVDISPSPTTDFACWGKEKECEIANSLGFHIDGIVSFSPDLQWVVVSNMQGLSSEKYTGGLRFIKANGNTEWEFSSDQQMKQDIGECVLFWDVNFWSDDSRYSYFSPDPSYCSRPFNYSAIGTQALYRLDVQTGEVAEILPFKSTSFQKIGLYTFEFSHNGKLLAYFQTIDSPIIVKIRDLSTDHETAFSLEDKYHEAGCLVWTTDNQHIIFYAAKDTHPGIVLTSSLLMVDVRQEKIQIIYPDSQNIYCPWNEIYDWEQVPNGENLIPVNLIGTDLGTNYFRFIERFYLNLFTGEKIKSAIPTP